MSRQLAETTGTTVRVADNAGTEAAADPRLREQLTALSGRRLSQYSIGGVGIQLSFWGENIATPGREILIEEETVEITQPGQQAQPVAGPSELTAVCLLNTLDHRLSRAEIDDGRLRLTFDNDFHLEVAPHRQWEAWQISSEDGLLIVCTPGGDLTIWYAEADEAGGVRMVDAPCTFLGRVSL
jgi:Family of unknown function (DUF6188)